MLIQSELPEVRYQQPRLCLLASRSLLLLFVVAALVGCNRDNLRGAIPNDAAAKEMRLTLAKSEVGQSVTDSSTAQTQQRTGWGTLKGRIRVVGSVPANRVLNINKDQAGCQPGGAAVRSETVEVDPATGGLANVLLYALDLNGDNVHEDAKSGKTEPILYDQKVCRYLSHVLPMQTTQSLEVKNSDTVSHNTQIQAKRGRSINENIPPGSSIAYSPGKEEKEPISVSCAVHPWMKAYLLPRDNGYFVATEQDGAFEIANLPAGVDLSVQAWQEKLGKNFDGIKVNGEPATWKRGRIALNLKPDETVMLDIEIPASVLE